VHSSKPGESSTNTRSQGMKEGKQAGELDTVGPDQFHGAGYNSMDAPMDIIFLVDFTISVFDAP